MQGHMPVRPRPVAASSAANPVVEDIDETRHILTRDHVPVRRLRHRLQQPGFRRFAHVIVLGFAQAAGLGMGDRREYRACIGYIESVQHVGEIRS